MSCQVFQRLLLLVIVVLAGSAARADDETAVGQVSVLSGAGSRYPGAAGQDPEKLASGAGVPLKAGDAVVLGDVLRLTSGAAKVTLNDGSVLMLGSEGGAGHQTGALLAISEADFKDQVRSSFSAKLMWGKVWSHVTKALAGSDAKFEVTTPRAVAGVRGTIFRVDAVKFVSATRAKDTTRVRVAEGKVAVEARVKLAMAGAPKKADGAPRHQISGPQEISKDEWEKKFVELQKGMQVEIGEELWKPSSYDASKKDAFDDFVGKNQ